MQRVVAALQIPRNKKKNMKTSSGRGLAGEDFGRESARVGYGFVIAKVGEDNFQKRVSVKRSYRLCD